MGRVVADAPIKPAEGLSLSRWSRLKREQRAAASSSPMTEESSERISVAASAPLIPTPFVQGVESSVELPPLSSISLTEDFTPFMQAKVPQLLKQQALKALFKDPHFNAMDGLDIYIDDYTVFEPISAEDMGKLSAWKSIQNPLKQVVTPGGYAVDVESEEGRAVLAEQARVEALGVQSNHDNLLVADAAKSTDDKLNDDQQKPSPAARERVPDRAGEGDGLERDDGPAEVARPSEEDAQSTALTPALSRAAGEGAEPAPAMAPQRIATPLPHPRYGKRVSDFTFIDATPELQGAAPDVSNKKTIEKPQ